MVSKTSIEERKKRYSRIAAEAREMVEAASGLIDKISQGHETFRLYDTGHTKSTAATDSISKHIKRLLTNSKSATIDVGVRRFLINHLPIFEISKGAGNLHRQFQKMEIGGVTFIEGVSKGQVYSFMRLLSEAMAAGKNRHFLDHALESEGVKDIVLELPLIEDTLGHQPGGKKSSDIDQGEEGVESLILSAVSSMGDRLVNSPSKTYQVTVGFVKDMLKCFKTPSQINPHEINAMAQGLAGCALRNPDAMVAMAVSGKIDDYHYLHPVNTAIFSVITAASIFNDPEMINNIARACLLFDIGKCGIGRDLLTKPENLSKEELEKIRAHPLQSAQAIERIGGLDKLETTVAFEHHIDQKRGYPSQEVKTGTNIATKIVMMADALDALTGNAVYRKPLPYFEAMSKLMEEWEGKPESALLTRLIRSIGVYPPGTAVVLTSDEAAVVTASVSKKPLFPKVRLVADKIGKLKRNGPQFVTDKTKKVAKAFAFDQAPFLPLDFYPFD